MIKMTATTTAEETYRKDMRFRAHVQSAVAAAVKDYGSIDPERAIEAAISIATAATMYALHRAFDEDAELRYARMERDAMRERMLTLAQLMPLAPATVPSGLIAEKC